MLCNLISFDYVGCFKQLFAIKMMKLIQFSAKRVKNQDSQCNRGHQNALTGLYHISLYFNMNFHSNLIM